MNRLHIGFLFAAILASLLACQPASQPQATAPVAGGTVPPAAAPPGAAATIIPLPPVPPTTATRGAVATSASTTSGGLLVYTSADGSLSLQDLTTKVSRVLLQATSKEFFDGPAFSPDGTRVVYVYTVFDSPAKLTTEVRSIGVDGRDVRTLFQVPGTGPQTFFGYPRYSTDGSVLTFSVIINGATSRDNLYQVVRGPASGSAWTLLFDEGYEAEFARDGKKTAFLRIDPKTFLTSLWLANADGSAPQALVAPDIFMEVAGPHFTTDGQWVVFAASGPPSRKLPTSSLATPGSMADRCALRLLFVCLIERAHANGLPWDLWQVSVDGKHFKQLTNLQLDSPWPAISRDGKTVTYMAFDGTFTVDRQTGAVTKISDEGGHGVIDWWQQ